jgi:hypothetical protein
MIGERDYTIPGEVAHGLISVREYKKPNGLDKEIFFFLINTIIEITRLITKLQL